jgi:hypothetical protein
VAEFRRGVFEPGENFMNNRKLVVGITLGLAALAAQAQTDISVSVGGEIKPGVYGRIDIGTRPPPPVVYQQPVIIQQPVVVVGQPAVVAPQPVYMHVPPGHAKKWSKHCHKYGACGTPVYFVKAKYEDDDRKGRGRGKHKHDD